METICTPDFPGQGLGGSGHRLPNLEDSPNMHKNSDFIFSTLKKGAVLLRREFLLYARHCARYSTYIILISTHPTTLPIIFPTLLWRYLRHRRVK